MLNDKKDREVVTKSGIKYTISSKVKRRKISLFEKRADESVKFLEKAGFPEEFKKKK